MQVIRPHRPHWARMNKVTAIFPNACLLRVIKNMKKKQVSLVFLALLACLNGHAAEPPNIVIILADDLGYGGISSYNNTTIRTPNLDFLASEGVIFTDFHSNGANCSPTRAALMTIFVWTSKRQKNLFYPVPGCVWSLD